jgi:hypothetical protein
MMALRGKRSKRDLKSLRLIEHGINRKKIFVLQERLKYISLLNVSYYIFTSENIASGVNSVK